MSRGIFCFCSKHTVIAKGSIGESGAPPTKAKGSNDFRIREISPELTILEKSLGFEFFRARENLIIMEHGTGHGELTIFSQR